MTPFHILRCKVVSRRDSQLSLKSYLFDPKLSIFYEKMDFYLPEYWYSMVDYLLSTDYKMALQTLDELKDIYTTHVAEMWDLEDWFQHTLGSEINELDQLFDMIRELKHNTYDENKLTFLVEQESLLKAEFVEKVRALFLYEEYRKHYDDATRLREEIKERFGVVMNPIKLRY